MSLLSTLPQTAVRGVPLSSNSSMLHPSAPITRLPFAAVLSSCAGQRHSSSLNTSISSSEARQQRTSTRASTEPPSTSSASSSSAELGTGEKRVVVLGGSGRVGSSTASYLLRHEPNARIAIACRTADSHRAAVQRRPDLAVAEFVQCDIDDPASLAAAIKGADLVVHCAGPFQRKPTCAVLEACISAGVPTLDVCDDMEFSQMAKTCHERAVAAGVPAITTAGIYPGISNVMAAHMVSIARKEYDDDWNYVDAAPLTRAGGAEPRRILYSYFTAGSGGAGPTILETSFLLAGEDVVVYKDGERLEMPAVSNARIVDFGRGIGRRSVYLYNLPEVVSGHQTFGVPSISARFGTDPQYWNWAMVLTARLLPKSFLSDRSKVKGFAAFVDPVVRLVDKQVGEKMAMLVEVELDNGQVAAGLYVHKYLSECVGVASGAFARCMLAGATQPGVWFPEERGALKDRRALLQMSAEGTYRFELNRTPWQLESDPIQIGMGFYW